MKRYGFPENIRIEVFAMKENAPVFLETQPEYENGTACNLHHIKIMTEIALPFV